MQVELFAWPAVVIVAAASTILFITVDWRWRLGLLALQYLAAFALVAEYWPIGMAAVKLITGWMVTAALGITRLNIPQVEDEERTTWLEARPFRLFGAGIVVLIGFAAAPRIEALIPGIGLPVAIGSLILMGAGLLQLGTSSQALRVVVGLLMLLCGFETLYAAVESSILVTGLLSMVDLGLGLAGSYLLLNSVSPAEEEGL